MDPNGSYRRILSPGSLYSDIAANLHWLNSYLALIELHPEEPYGGSKEHQDCLDRHINQLRANVMWALLYVGLLEELWNKVCSWKHRSIPEAQMHTPRRRLAAWSAHTSLAVLYGMHISDIKIALA